MAQMTSELARIIVNQKLEQLVKEAPEPIRIRAKSTTDFFGRRGNLNRAKEAQDLIEGAAYLHEALHGQTQVPENNPPALIEVVDVFVDHVTVAIPTVSHGEKKQLQDMRARLQTVQFALRRQGA